MPAEARSAPSGNKDFQLGGKWLRRDAVLPRLPEEAAEQSPHAHASVAVSADHPQPSAAGAAALYQISIFTDADQLVGPGWLPAREFWEIHFKVCFSRLINLQAPVS